MLSQNDLGRSQNVIPAFIAKLWHMVSDSEGQHLISWGKGGTTFIIKDHNKFSSEMLPMYYKHNNMASFIRQLNMYNFHKVTLVESSSLKNQNELEFSHKYFIKGQPDLLTKIQRKIHHAKEPENVKCDPVMFNSLLKEVKQLRTIQELFSTKLSVMKKENAALWREHSILRQRHAKQEKIVNKVIHFLISMVQQSTINVSRRKGPLMIKDRPVLIRPSSKKKFVRVTNPKSPPIICEVDSQDLTEVNGEIIGEEVSPEELLLSYNPNEDSQDLTSDTPQTEQIQQIIFQQPGQDKPKNILFKAVKRKSQTLKPTHQVKRLKKENNSEAMPENVIPSYSTEEQNPSNSARVNTFNSPSPEYILCDDISDLLKCKTAGSETSNDFLRVNNTDNQLTDLTPGTLINNLTNPQVLNVSEQSISQLLNSNKKQAELNQTKIVPSPIPYVTSPSTSVPSPASQSEITTSDALLDSIEIPQDVTAKSPTNNVLQLALPTDINDSIKNKEDAECHLDRVQSDLDVLKDLLKSEGISLDANMVLELFNDNPVSLNMGPAGESHDSQLLDEPSSSDQALISYTPSFFDFTSQELSSDPEQFTMDDEAMPDYVLNTPKVQLDPPYFPDSK